MAAETGRALVLHVADRAAMATLVDEVLVTAPDPEILDVVKADGIEAIRTGEHPNGTSRLAEVVERLGDAVREGRSS